MKTIAIAILSMLLGAAFGAAIVVTLPGLPRVALGPEWDVVEGTSGAQASSNEIETLKSDGLKMLARAAVLRVLNDPYSAKFEAFNVRKNDKGLVVVCGLVNAKNGFGAYVGSTPFVYIQVLDAAHIYSRGTDADAAAGRAYVSNACSKTAAVP